MPYCIILQQNNSDCTMHLLKHHGVSRAWRTLLIVVAVLSLTVSVATRFTVTATSQTQGVSSVTQSIVQPHRQRLNRDAAQWVAPVIISIFASLVISYSRNAPPQPRFAIYLSDDSPYNRPPPSLN